MMISIHVPRVEDDGVGVDFAVFFSPISIHVPRVEDDGERRGKDLKRGISIHVPRVEDDDTSMLYVI